jgi:hypothetical protein
MGTPTTWRNCSLTSAAMERIELMVGKFANRIRAFPFHRTRLPGARSHSLFGRWREMPTALRRFTPSPTINSVLSVAGDLRRPQAASLKFRWRSLLKFATAGPLADGVETYHPQADRTLRWIAGA